MTMTKPIIHLGGTSPATLFDQAAGVRHAARDLLAALEAAAPNGRDYVGNPQLLEAARKEHAARIAAVRAIQSYYEDLVIDLCDHV